MPTEGTPLVSGAGTSDEPIALFWTLPLHTKVVVSLLVVTSLIFNIITFIPSTPFLEVQSHAH